MSSTWPVGGERRQARHLWPFGDHERAVLTGAPRVGGLLTPITGGFGP